MFAKLGLGPYTTAVAAFVGTFVIGGLVVVNGEVPTLLTTFFVIPIVFVAYRYPLAVSVSLVAVASVFTSPAVELVGVAVDEAVLPVLWLGWPAVYLFLVVSVNQWASLQQQKAQLDATQKNLMDLGERNDRRQQELETLSAIHTTVLSGDGEPAVIQEITSRIAQACGAKICTITIPDGPTGQRPFLPTGFSEGVFTRFFPEGAPFGEGVDGWAMLHRRVSTSRNVFEDARYDELRNFAALVGFVSAAAAPIELDMDLYGALVLCYADEREFTPEELKRLERLARQTELAIRSVRQRESLSRFAFETALALTEAIESRDPYTGGHCRRLADHAGLVAANLALAQKEIEVVRLGAALHDMGKIAVPDSTLKKPGRLTPEEYAIVKQHCYSGGQICKRVGFLMNAYPIVYHHHERWDGMGYPDGLKGEQIPLGARIVAVMDAFDAMTTDRPYRDAMSLEEAISILRDGAGSQWDRRVIEVTLDLIEQGRIASDVHVHERSGGLPIVDGVNGGRRLAGECGR